MQLVPPVDASDEERERAALLDNRRRVLAVLSVLAVTPRPLTRDQLADFFWSDSDPAKAKHSLAEALRLLRRVLGAEILAPRAADLVLDPGTPLQSDVAQFIAAHTAGDHAGAIAVYAADLLDGIYVERAPRFEEWVERQRESLRRQFAASCEAECRRLSHAGDHGRAATVARRWLDTAPLSYDAAEAWIRALTTPGTTEAVRQARERFTHYANQLREEYDAVPDKRLTRLMDDAEQALASRQQATPTAASPVAPANPSTPPLVGTAGVAPPVATPVATSPRVTSPPMMAPSRTRRRALGVLAGLAAVVGIAWTSDRIGKARPVFSSTPDRRTLLVMADVENATPDTLLGHAVALAMSTALNESDALRVLPPSRVQTLRRLSTAATDSVARFGPFTEALARTVALRAGASAVAVPLVVALGPQFRMALRVVRPGDGTVLATVQSDAVAPTELMGALDAVIRSALRKLGGAREATRQRPLPEYTTTSLEALQAFAEGARAFNADRTLPAIDAYRQAVALDSTFALAWNALGRALAFNNNPQGADSAFRRAERYLDRLSDREQTIVRASVARARGVLDSAIAVRGRWLATHPDDAEMLRAQAYDLLTRGRKAEAVRIAEAYVQRDSLDEIVWTNLALSYEADDPLTRQKAVAAFGRAVALDTNIRYGPLFTQRYGDLLVRAQMYDSAERTFRWYADKTPVLRARAARSLGQLELWRGRPAAAIAPLREAVAHSRVAFDTLGRVRSRLWLASALQLSGQPSAEAVQLDTLVQEAPLVREPVVLYWVGLSLARQGRLADAQRVLQGLTRRVVSSSVAHGAARDLLAAEIAAARGDAARVLPTLAATAQVDSSDVTYETLAWVTLQAGDTSAARAQALALVQHKPAFGFEGWLARGRAQAWLSQIGDRGTR
ncbi:MAG: hypothetical protein K2R93_21890 [Gemmatimonadaceae bacterium]|nr:hypothetical protein [Gemmatimonadaceae bacterium]